jgi:hypothetical protein
MGIVADEIIVDERSPFDSSCDGSAIYSRLIHDYRLSRLAEELGAVDAGDSGDGGDHHAGK